MGYGLGGGQGTVSFPFCAVYTSRGPERALGQDRQASQNPLSLSPAWGGPSPSLAATIALFPRAGAHVEAPRIADVEVGSPPETFPSVLLSTDGEAEAQKGRGVGPGSRSMGAWTPEACGWLFPLARSYAITILMATYFIT